ncbi:endonuclease/exonuclease/phosphatase family domain-containing protein 1-like [Lineus longissimus]|uniref:endonuclease/exonuclease/phosphatase family domain-containing protein 1-like n=1 Tax=Lineus longissimus TaxID=88925 RepID=UPI002B4F94D5
MGGVNSMCIPRNNPSYCHENHMTPRKIKGHKRNLSATFNMVTDADSVDTVVDLLNINLASEEELMTLPGINRNVAKEIVAYRKQIDGFKKVEDLALVSGVGAAKLGVIRQEICVKRNQGSLSTTPSSSHLDLPANQSERLFVNNRLKPSNTSVRPKPSINDSNIFQLMKVKGLNQVLAENIVSYRDKKGRFRGMDDLVKVKGIHPALLAAFRHRVLLNAEKPPPRGNGFLLQQSAGPGVESDRSSDSKSLKSTETTSLLGGMNLSASQVDILSQFEPLKTKHVRPVCKSFNFRRDDISAFRVGSWNVERFNLAKACNPGCLEVVCMTVLENGLSLVAFQELADKEALEKVCAELNHPSLPKMKRWSGHRGSWKCAVSDATGRMYQGNEYNGFLYDTSNGLELFSAELIQKASSKSERYFVRRPYMGFFKIDNFDFVLASVHLKASGQRSEHMDDLQKEILAIPSLVEAVQDHIISEKDIILVGDFNLESQSEDFNDLRDAGYVNVLDDENTNISEVNLKGNRQYDHIWVNKQTRRVYTKNSHVVREGLSHPFIPDGRWGWGGLVSDHCPIWAEFYTNKDYDRKNYDIDLNNILLKPSESSL